MEERLGRRQGVCVTVHVQMVVKLKTSCLHNLRGSAQTVEIFVGAQVKNEGETTCFGDQHVKVKEFGLKVELDRPLKIVHPLAAYACLAQSHKAPFLCSSGKATKIQVVDFVCVLRVYPKTGHCLWQCRESSLALLWRQLAKVKVADQNA